MKTVFVDTSAFYAVLDARDPFHRKALDCFERAKSESWDLVTTNYVLHESWALVQARLGWNAMDAWLDKLASLCRVAWVDQSIHRLGQARCRQARDRRLSFTDCISFEVMRQEGIAEAIAQDEHFDREGFKLP